MKDQTLSCGVLNLYKPAGMTSFQAVSQVKRMTGVKKCGHAGTLDPDAQGVLPVFLGTATGACNYLEDEQKEYQAEILLGFGTDTDDLSGRITCISDYDISYQRFMDCLSDFTGDLYQLPPAYSAVKVKGRKLYEYARQGNTEIIVPKRKVTVHSISIMPQEGYRYIVKKDDNEYQVSRFNSVIRCSRGTYIRSLCRDIGQALGTCGCMGNLIRTESGPYRIEDAIRFEDLKDSAEKALLPVADLFSKYEKVELNKKQAEDYLNGKKFIIDKNIKEERQTVAVNMQEHGFIGMGELIAEESVCYLKGKKLFCHPFI